MLINVEMISSYLEGYKDAIEDVESSIPLDKKISVMDLLNSVILTLHACKEELNEGEEVLEILENYMAEKEFAQHCAECGECMEAPPDKKGLNDLIETLTRSGFTVIKGGK